MDDGAAMGAIGHGIATIGADGVTLDAWFPNPALTAEPGPAGTERLDPAQVAARLGDQPGAGPRADAARAVTLVPVTTRIADLRAPPRDASDAYLRLHLLSHRLVAPRGLNLDGMFGLLANVAWTTLGPCLPDRLDALRWHARAQGTPLGVRSVDKIPRMTDYVVPAGVRIADANRVRLGAHLSAGTTVMQEGFCNFNAGTLGASMVEGRISAGVIVGEGTDIGGGASIMGTLSGGGREMITIGERCLLGANAGLGIALGNDCVVEAGCYVTAGTLVRTPDGAVVKAATLSGRDGLLFRRHSQTGAVEAIVRRGSWGALNPMLHAV